MPGQMGEDPSTPEMLQEEILRKASGIGGAYRRRCIPLFLSLRRKSSCSVVQYVPVLHGLLCINA